VQTWGLFKGPVIFSSMEERGKETDPDRRFREGGGRKGGAAACCHIEPQPLLIAENKKKGGRRGKALWKKKNCRPAPAHK